jgi:hypothetical protein
LLVVSPSKRTPPATGLQSSVSVIGTWTLAAAPLATTPVPEVKS